MRVGGRLEKSTCGFDEKHQIILPKQHQLTGLILLHEHKRLMHCGVQALCYVLKLGHFKAGRDVEYALLHPLAASTTTYSKGQRSTQAPHPAGAVEGGGKSVDA
ncbi:hypothetical protein NQ318_001304, partial [Aromia moschata]